MAPSFTTSFLLPLFVPPTVSTSPSTPSGTPAPINSTLPLTLNSTLPTNSTTTRLQCTPTTATTPLPKWYTSSRRKLSKTLISLELVSLVSFEAGVPVWAGAGGTIGDDGVIGGNGTAARECWSGEGCYSDGKGEKGRGVVCLNSNAQTLHYGPLIISPPSLTFTLPDCSTGSLKEKADAARVKTWWEGVEKRGDRAELRRGCERADVVGGVKSDAVRGRGAGWWVLGVMGVIGVWVAGGGGW
ncbi:hypothetical protein EX30DRAFT_375004 [Ascodesmis nigricans]|uniref:Ig-like domain-containing protein n=1 Tax=Ascodesmis nigricans TaxID=341454 RepID=A0A4S2MJM7_9PEZI|nr:hypothetical protein EX30DRAFT_375004 [Ascodesmis nigricans]